MSRFEVGRIYNRREELHAHYGGQAQGGISTPGGHPFIMLFTGESGEQYGYSDGWTDEGVFVYTGEGQRGDMSFVRGNRAIRDHAQDGKELELFKALGKGKGYRYLGQFTSPTWEYREGNDVDGVRRQTIAFHLVPFSDVAEISDSVDTTEPIETLRKRAYDAATDSSSGTETVAKRVAYERSKAVRDYVLKRADGTCECCQQPAPFKRDDGSPYLEPHHTRRVSDGGPDHPRWVAAVCPNCHREIHCGENGDRKNRELQAYLAAAEEQLSHTQ
jgi:5-methylcytosine-specific restriction protein A